MGTLASQAILAIDIGGTSTKLGVVSLDGQLRHHRRIPTSPPAPDFCDALVAQMEKLNALESAAAIGISVAGFIDPAHSAMIYNPNLPWLEGFPLRFLLARHFHLPVEIEVDSNAGALGEFHFGAGAGSGRLLVLTVGTGIGGGMIAGGELVRFTHECLGDVGHLIVEPGGPACTCGGRGCAEAVATAPAILARNPGALRLEDIPPHDAAFAVAGNHLGVLSASLAAMFFPDRIVLGGGVCAASPLVVEHARATFTQNAGDVFRRDTAIISAKLGAHAPLIGAACRFLNLSPRPS